MKRTLSILVAVLALGFAFWKLGHRSRGPAKPASDESPLYTGKEPKFRVRISFPAAKRPGFVQEGAEIFLTESRGAQAKQLLQKLFGGPKGPEAAAAFPAAFKYREVFYTETGLAVIDLDAESVASHPGGTSSEFVSLYCLVRTVLDNFKDIKRVQILVGGETRESLAGHMDISGPLTLEDF